MSSTIIRHDDGKPSVVVKRGREVKRELNIPTRAQARAFVKKKALFVLSFSSEDGEQIDFLMRKLMPSELAEVFGTLFGKSAEAASKKLTGDEDKDKELLREELKEDLSQRVEQEGQEAVEDDFRTKVTNAIFKCMAYPPEFPVEEHYTPEDIDDFEDELRDDMFSFISSGITGEGDSVDSFSSVDQES